MTGPTEIHSLSKNSSAGGLERGFWGWASADVPCIDETFTNKAPAAEFFMAAHPVVHRGLTAS